MRQGSAGWVFLCFLSIPFVENHTGLNLLYCGMKTGSDQILKPIDRGFQAFRSLSPKITENLPINYKGDNREAGDGLICVYVFNAITDTVPDMSFQNHFSAAVQGGFGGIDLRQNIFTRNIFINHAVNSLYLSQNLFQ